ncbi:2'-5' RNA ligase family protein [Roseobacter weihaiensis]|uniref:2'-5' RNA ligase family protein n=1 Tax=Roseobacter weihaiensis TaxID=2763262 RepID=UPI001D09E89A|nr:2'-5' RNA ligase family protein [Roseobacter sp. H9]
MQTRGPQAHSIWLCPEARFAALLQDEIMRLTAISGTDVFAPHVTLLGDLAADPRATSDHCGRLAGAQEPISVMVKGLCQTDQYYMSLFLDLDIPAHLGDMRAKLAMSLLGGAPGRFRPHISLAYGIRTEGLQTEDLRRLERAFLDQVFCLDRICVVAAAKKVPISAWRVLDTMPFGKPPRSDA